MVEHKSKKEAEKSAKKAETKKEEVKEEEKEMENKEDQKKAEENIQKNKTEDEVNEEAEVKEEHEEKPSKDEAKEEPKDRTALNSPGRTLPLPTVPGISPPTPRSIGSDSPRAGQRVASPIRPGTPQRGAPIELPILPGVRHPVPKVASPKPLSPTPNRRSPSASPSHVTRDKEISVFQTVPEQTVTSVTSVAPVTEVTTSTVSRRLPQSSPVAVQSVSSRGAPVKTQGTFVPPVGQQQNRPEIHVGQKRKIFEETTTPTAQPSGQIIKSVAQNTKPALPPAKIVKTHQMSHQVISQAAPVSHQTSSNQQHVVKNQSVIQATSNPPVQSVSIQPTHTAASHGMQRVIQQPKQQQSKTQQHQQQHVQQQQQQAAAAAHQQAFLADRIRQQQQLAEQQVQAQKVKQQQQQNQMIADQAAAQRQQEQLAVKQAAAAAQQQAVQQQQRQAAAQAKKTADKKKSEQATGTKLQQKQQPTDVTASLSSKEYQEMILKSFLNVNGSIILPYGITKFAIILELISRKVGLFVSFIKII